MHKTKIINQIFTEIYFETILWHTYNLTFIKDESTFAYQ